MVKFEIAASPCIEVANTLPPTKRAAGGFGSTNPVSKRMTHQSFQLDQNYILAINNSNPFRPVARKIKAPVCQPSSTTSTDNGTRAETLSITPITSHNIDVPSEELDPILHQTVAPIPSTLPSDIPSSPNTPTTSPTAIPSTTPSPTCNEAVNTTLPKKLVLSQDALHRAVGFYNTHNLLKYIHEIGTKSVQIQQLPKLEHIDPGETASMPSQKHQTKPSILPKHYSDIWHMDIGHGPCTAIGGARYTLLLVDKATRFKFVFGLTNLTTSLLTAMKRFIMLSGVKPKLICTDFDSKLIGGEVESYLLDQQIHIEASPPYRQHQNGLVERHWQSILSMSRNWLRSSMLPTKYCFFAVKRAIEISNIMPTKHKNKVTTPYELVYKRKPDFRQLFPQFSIAYIRQHRQDNKDIDSWTAKSLKCIVVGSCSKSNGLLFYHPPSKQLLTCSDGYRFDPFSPSGPQFGEFHEHDFEFTTKSAISNIHSTPTHVFNDTAFIKSNDNYEQVRILDMPIDEDIDPYTVQHIENGNILQLMHDELHDHDPNANPKDAQDNLQVPFPHLPWVQHKAKITLYLPHIMTRPKQGYLNHEDNTWSFIAGRTKKGRTIPLPNFPLLIDSLVANKKIFKGWVNSTQAATARRIRMTSNLIANLIISSKVSAANLHDQQTPSSLLNHYKLHPHDKVIWDKAYAQEYQGLQDIDTWEYISETDYQNCKHIFGKLMPTMAISVIKKDENGKPVRCKYRIVALGNLDPHAWSKTDCFAPVLSQMELRLIVALAVRAKRELKSGDVVQAFCQSYLPHGENYICTPPPGCTITPPGM